MSKIIDGLSRGAGEIADTIRQLVEVQPGTRTAAESSGKTDTRVAPQAAIPAISPLAEIRTHSLRLAAPSPLMPFEDGQWRPSEEYRILRTKVSQHVPQPRLIVISSPAPGDGKSVTAINSAGALSLKSEGKVLLLDADLRKSSIHEQLGLAESPGLTDVLRGHCSLEEALVHTQEFPNLFVMAAGTRASNPVELLDSPQWRELAARLRGLFRYVILDSPPVGAVADYDLIQAICDSVILVVRPDHTDRRLCLKALENIPKPKFLGVLLNCVPEWSLAKQGGTDYYYYSSKRPYPAVARSSGG